ncbi:MAG: GNAT family N-acetyltransferase [Deltaproteobacteria bacterium]|nr:MAG: GNAT family N-acetyltransferase [Deltaproteobacteria bacterium]
MGAVKGKGEAISAPEHLTPAHDLSAFDSSVPELDEWLRRRARANEETGASRTSVDRAYQGRGIGRGLLRDAVVRTLQAAEIGGIRAILVHAISEDAKHFYESSGFAVSPVDPMTLTITVADAEKALGRR